ncbi:MAG: phosphatidate cytidylyltransferase [Oscillospiraceae bacterium]|nr:phosphatidate cytidylyltransferase [Oscillospiraceae bacterium]
MIKKRLLPAAMIVIVTWGCILLSRPTRLLFFMALAVMSAFEMQNVLTRAGKYVSMPLLAVYGVVQGILVWCHAPVAWMVALFAFVAFLVMFWGILKPDKGANFAADNLFVLVWPFGFYAIALYAAGSDVWLDVLCIAILGAWACDSMALIGGSALGKHKLAPRVSPNKTWEGSIIGAVSAAVAGVLISLVLKPFAPVPMGLCAATAFIASCFGQVGDLAASMIKRMAGVKDYGHLMPEHGGIMDKMDSILFAIPAAYLCLYIAGIA